MRKAILCFAHKDSYVLNALIKQSLYGTEGQTDFFIHLDKKSEKMKSEVIKSPNVFFIENNVSVTWGDDTMMWALRNSVEEISNKGRNYDYMIICTGQDLWVKSGIDEFLEKNNGKIWLDTVKKDSFYRNHLTHYVPRCFCRFMSNIPFYHPVKLSRSIYFRLIRFNLIGNKHIKCDLDNLTFYYSFNWSIMPYEVFLYMVDFMKNNPEYMRLYEKTLLPEDGFLGTMIMNSPYASNVVKDPANTLGRTKSSTYWNSDINLKKEVHMTTITVNSKDAVEASGCWLARKFDSKVDKEIVDYYLNLVTNK